MKLLGFEESLAREELEPETVLHLAEQKGKEIPRHHSSRSNSSYFVSRIKMITLVQVTTLEGVRPQLLRGDTVD